MILVQLLMEAIMTGKSKRAALLLTPEQRAELKLLTGSRTAPAREVERAKVLLGYADGASITQIQRQVGVGRPMIYKRIDKALAAGVEVGLKDRYHRPHEPEITDEAKAWVVALACTKPKDHGLAAELWSISELAKFVRERAQDAGFARLSKAGKSTVWRILDGNDIKPHQIRYYLEKRDPEFDRKMQEVLLVYRDVSLYREGAVHDARPEPIYSVSVDEKPGVQAIGLTAPDLPPVPGKASAVGRDYEYVRHGTVSILAAIDLHSGHILGTVQDRHRSVEFIELLKRLDEHYPPQGIIRVVLDNHSAHISKETMAYLNTRPGRFEYVHTPKHGSWLNLIESAFSKMARTFLRHIRVTSVDELKARILKGIDEFNASPVVFRWNKFDLGVA
jgi:transposase